ncbi:helix-turn-helix domain-containing protein [Streptomyces litchfieldiae]|uniref:helix-turn-helix domain-containing protein n=1 Tax=Streptomyces litchfieldiae TaxID=3075543 RepID=UPI00288AFBC5|nr:helix-turn-helix transcriptional regulator [Streptomyces sp. DSM 44938]
MNPFFSTQLAGEMPKLPAQRAVEAAQGAELSALGHFGTEVRLAREGRKLKQKHVADGTGYSVAYVSKVENGVILPSNTFAERLDVVLGTGGLFVRLRRRLEETETPTWFVPYLKLEPRAARILDWSVHCLIGVLQTEDYARAILRAGNPAEPPEIVESMVKARMRRRRDAFAATPRPQLWSVIHEACLRTVVGGPAVMGAQLRHLLDVATSPGIDVQVLPLTAGGEAAHTPAFTILTFADGTPDTLWTDGPLGGRLSQAQAYVRSTRDINERLRASALPPRDSVDMIRKIAEELE